MKASTALSVLSGLGGALAQTNSTTNSTQGVFNVVPLNSSLLATGFVDLGIAEEAYQKAATFVSGLTNAQKVKIITGQSLSDPAHTFKALSQHDGDSGINQNFYVSGFSMVHALAMTFNKELYYEQFKALGDENFGMGYTLVAGPVLSPLGRVPAGGRHNEAYSPDPYLSGVAMGQSIAGMGAAGVLTSGRHFLYNEQETNRMAGGGPGGGGGDAENYSSDVDDKTAHEVYLWPFADGVKNGLMAVMCGMNRANDSLSCQNDVLLNKFLKTQIGFPGLVMPDVGSQNSSYLSANAGLDLGSAQYWSDAVMEAGITSGAFSQARLDDMAVRNLIGYFHAGLDTAAVPTRAGNAEYRNVRGNHSALILKVAQEALVLVKNDNTAGGGLPLNKPRTIAIFGAHAGPSTAGPNAPFSVGGSLTGDTYPGHNVMGGGSGALSLGYVVTPQMALTNRAIVDESMIWWILNDTYVNPYGSGLPGGGGGGPGGNIVARQFPGGGGNPFGNSGTGVSASIPNYATQAEVCIVFLNSASGEGADRSELTNVDMDNMVISVATNCNNTVVVVNTAGPRLIDAWVENANVTAVIYSGLLGQNSGQAIADVLHGDVNPSGKLGHTIAKTAEDYPAAICTTTSCPFEEGVYLDYRWFDLKGTEPRYPFGHGLSYTTFTIGTPAAAVTDADAVTSRYPTLPMGLGGEADLWTEIVSVTTTVTNTGKVAGGEVAQLYVTFPDEAEQPIRVLRGFEKVFLEPGASSLVTFSVLRRDLSYWDVAAQQWALASGDYIFSAAASSRDIRGTVTLTI